MMIKRNHSKANTHTHTIYIYIYIYELDLSYACCNSIEVTPFLHRTFLRDLNV